MSDKEKDLKVGTKTNDANPHDLLVKFGGFGLIEAVIDGAQNLNPERKARKQIFLTEAHNKDSRKELKDKLALWAAVLAKSDDIAEVIGHCETEVESANATYKKNVKAALDRTKELEQAYRSLALFFKNTEAAKVKNINIMNCSMEQRTDLDVTTFFDTVESEFADNYDRLDLRDNYGLLVMPGYLGSNKVVDKWSKMCHKNKVMMVTDFQHLDSPDDVIELFEHANLASGDIHKSNVIMGANWLVGREKAEQAGEEEALYVPPAGALAGHIYKTMMSQVAAGKKHGSLSEVDGVAFPLRKGEIAEMEKLGLVPMVNEYGKVMAFSAKTLFNGDNIGLQTYSVVRVFDYVSKTLMDFLNRRAFENFNVQTKKEIRLQIQRFLESVCGPGKLIEKFKILRFEQDPNQKDRIFLDIHMTPFFPAKNYVFKLDGHKGDDGTEWASQVGES